MAPAEARPFPRPFPAALEDCYGALKWMAGSAVEPGPDPARTAIAGASSGGGLTARLALLARDRGAKTCSAGTARAVLDPSHQP